MYLQLKIEKPGLDKMQEVLQGVAKISECEHHKGMQVVLDGVTI